MAPLGGAEEVDAEDAGGVEVDVDVDVLKVRPETNELAWLAATVVVLANELAWLEPME